MAISISEFSTQWLEESERAQKILLQLNDEWLSTHRYSAAIKKAKELIFYPIHLLKKMDTIIPSPQPSPYYPRTMQQLREDHLAVIQSVREQIILKWQKMPLNEGIHKRGGRTREAILMRLLSGEMAIRLQFMHLLHQADFKIQELYPKELA